MNKLVNSKTGNPRPILFLIIGVFAFSSCKITFIPNYDSAIAAKIDETAMNVDKFYLSMLETSSADNEGRAYMKFVDQYVDLEVQITSLLNKNKVRPLNENSTRICEITLQLWQKYKDEHKTENTLSNGLIKLNRKTFSDLFYAMQVAEEAKKIKDNPPQ